MTITIRGAIVGALALAGTTFATAEVQAMPVGPVAAPASAEVHLDQVYYYGYRRPFVRRFGYGYRPFGFGYRRFGYGYGYRRPFFRYGYGRPFGYGYRRFY